MQGNTAEARKALRILLDGDIVFSPVLRNGKKTLAFAGKTKAGALLSTPASEDHQGLAQSHNHIKDGVPTGIRTQVTAVKESYHVHYRTLTDDSYVLI